MRLILPLACLATSHKSTARWAFNQNSGCCQTIGTDAAPSQDSPPAVPEAPHSRSAATPRWPWQSQTQSVHNPARNLRAAFPPDEWDAPSWPLIGNSHSAPHFNDSPSIPRRTHRHRQTEADPPLHVDRDRILARSIFLEPMQPVAGRNPQIVHARVRFWILQLSQCCAPNLRRKSFRL